jgi:hypothetical protein
LFGRAQRQSGETGFVNLQDSDIRWRICANHFCRQFATILEGNENFRSIGNDVEVG